MPQAEHSLTNDNQTESPSFKANVCDPEAAQRGCGASGGLSAGALGHQAAAPIPLTVDPSLEKCERLELHENTCSCMCDALENMGSQLDSFVSMNTADVVAKVRSAAKRLAARLDETADEERLRQACLSLCDLFGDGIHHDLIQAILDTGVVPRVVRILEPLIEDDVCNVDPVHVQAPGLPECDMASTSNVRRQVGLASDDTESGSVSGEGNNGRDAAFSGQKNHKTILREGGRSTDRGRSNVVRRRFRRKEVSLGLQSAALQVIGNIACGDDRQTQVIIDCPNALAILRALLASPEPCIQKECCWIISNITESSHQVQDIIKAGVLVPLIGIFAGGHESCDEDAAWVLYNVTANGDPEQVRYLADIGGISALCSLLLSSAELEVAWKGCSTVAAVALRALTNVLIALPSEMPFRIASEYGVECLDLLAYGGGHTPVDHEHRQKAKELLEKFFKTNRVEQADGRRTSETMHSSSSKSATSSPRVRQERPPAINDNGALPETSESAVSLVMHETAGDFDEAKLSDSRHRHEIDHHIVGLSQTTDGACQHTRCEPRRATPAMLELPLPLCEIDSSAQHPYSSICAFCSGSDPRYNADAGDFIGSARREKNVALMARAIRMDHQPCLQRIIDSRMTWSDVALVLEKLIPEASGCYAGYQGLPSCTALFPHDTAMDASMLQSSIQLCPSKNLDSQFSRGGSAPGIADSRLLDSAGAEGSQMPLVYGRRSVLMLAAHLGRVECLRIILGRLRPTLSSDWMPFLCSSLLSGPAFKGHLEIVRMLLGYRRFSELPESKKVTMGRKVENEMNVFERETSELNALHLAAAAGHASICAELLNEFPEAVNTTDRNGTTALSFAAQFGHADACRVLLKHGADILALDRNGRTALHFACSRSRSETVQLLLEYAETAFKSREGDAFRKWLDARTTGGLTPLHHAIQGGNVDCVELLIRAGACIQDPLPDSSARNPLLVFAAEADSLEIAQLLLKAGASVKTFATMRIRIGDICDLLALSAPEDALNAEIEDIFTPLHIAASKGNVELVQMLMLAGAEINVRSVTGWSPLDLAVMNGFEAIASLLLAAGAIVDPNVKFIPKGSLGSISTGKTLVQIAAMSHRKELVRMLIERLRTQRTTEEQVLSSVAVEDIASAATSTDIGSVHMLERHGSEVDTADAAITSEMSVNRHATSPEIPESATKKRKESDKDVQRQRELRRRETEANEARERLLEAIQTRSLTKLQDAICIANRVILQLAAGYVKSGSAKLVGPEIGLGAEVERARRVLAALQAQQRRAAADRERIALEARQVAAHRQLLESIGTFFATGDVRVFDKALRRASKVELDDADSALRSVLELRMRLSKMQDAARELDEFLREVDRMEDYTAQITGDLRERAAKVEQAVAQFVELSVEAEKCSPVQRVRDVILRAQQRASDAETRLEEKARLLAVQNSKCQELCERIDLVSATLRQVRVTQGPVQPLTEAEESIESLAEEIRETLSDTGLQKEAESRLECARRALQKIARSERKRLRSVATIDDIEAIDEIIESVQRFGLNALKPDISNAMAIKEQKIQQREALLEWEQIQTQHLQADLNHISALRSRLEKLGLVEVAEKARLWADQLAREERTRQLLESTIAEVRRSEAAVVDLDNYTSIACFLSKGVDICLEEDIQKLRRLRELTERARRYDSLSDLVTEAVLSYDALQGKFGRLLDRMSRILDVSSLGDVHSIAKLESVSSRHEIEVENVFENDPDEVNMYLAAARVLRTLSDRIKMFVALCRETLRPAQSGSIAPSPTETRVDESLVFINTWLDVASSRSAEFSENARKLSEKLASEQAAAANAAEASTVQLTSSEAVEMNNLVDSQTHGSEVCTQSSEDVTEFERELASQKRSGRKARNRRRSVSTAQSGNEFGETPTRTRCSSEPDDSLTECGIQDDGRSPQPSAKTKSSTEKKRGARQGKTADGKVSSVRSSLAENSQTPRTDNSQEVTHEERVQLSERNSETNRRRRQQSKRTETVESGQNWNQDSELPEQLLSQQVPGRDAIATDCPHYYIWMRASIVVCGKCGDVRVSHNQNWLERVKKRTQKKKEQLPTEFMTAAEHALLSRRRRSTSRTEDAHATGEDSLPIVQDVDFDGGNYVARAATTMRNDAFQNGSRMPSERVHHNEFYWSVPAPFSIDQAHLHGGQMTSEISPAMFGSRLPLGGVANTAEHLEMNSRPGTPARTVSPFVDSFSSPIRNVSDGRSAPLYAEMMMGASAACNTVPIISPSGSPRPAAYRETLPVPRGMGAFSSSIQAESSDLASGLWLQTNAAHGANHSPFTKSALGTGQSSELLLDRAATTRMQSDESAFLFGTSNMFSQQSLLTGTEDVALSSSPTGVGDSEFASQNFGFNIDAIVDETPQPKGMRKDSLPPGDSKAQYRIF